VTSDTYTPAHKLSDAIRLKRLVGMLRSMSRKYPTARVHRNSRGEFGVSFDAQRSISVSCSGNWSGADLRDCFQLFAMWSLVEPEQFQPNGIRCGASYLAAEQRALSRGRLGWTGARCDDQV
jgi:hypothetical protein